MILSILIIDTNKTKKRTDGPFETISLRLCSSYLKKIFLIHKFIFILFLLPSRIDFFSSVCIVVLLSLFARLNSH
jgi:hypothetical protein